MCAVIFRIAAFIYMFDVASAQEPGSTIDYQPVWSYDDEANWPGRHCREGGRRQSPIDIKTSDVVHDFTKQFIKYGPLQFTGYHKVLVSGINNGHTIQFSSEGEEAIHPVLTGGPLKYLYRLEQLHFHWLSEHSINGVKYPMELHFVHVRADLTVYEALGKRDGLAIVSVFGNVQAELDDYQQEASELMQHIPKLLKTGDRISGVLLDMKKLLSPNRESYYTYSGSLTSPECNEAVIWIIFDSPIFLTDAQYRLFGKVGVGRHNFRSLQKLKHHVVFAPAETKLHMPQIVLFFEDVIRVISDFFTNVGTW
ncbi:carbonic anhydrase 1-like isoform X2 [Trichoplusia ni]|uniref:Carbonic anhydrase n=1 Tax=Trichoplusia ni TaxID=7111 RepID=A0A7E5VFS8_TRINI|nr:carbonic anhydrase 1-like isoform X2 [Trichoplusia ni]